MNVFLLKSGLTGMARMETRSDLLQQLQVVGTDWVREVTRTSARALSIEPNLCALASPRDATRGEETAGVYADLLWRRYRLYYFESPSGSIYRRDLDLSTPTLDPRPLERVDLGHGRQSLNFYASQGRRLSGDITACRFVQRGKRLHLELEARRGRYGKREPEALRLEFASSPRNS